MEELYGSVSYSFNCIVKEVQTCADTTEALSYCFIAVYLTGSITNFLSYRCIQNLIQLHKDFDPTV